MATYTGFIGNGSTYTDMTSPVSLRITMPKNEYPKGTLKLGNFSSSGARWINLDGNFDVDYWFKLYLCDSSGNNAYHLQTIKVAGGRLNTGANQWTVNCPNLRGKTLYMKASKSTVGSFRLRLYNRATTSCVSAVYSFNITVTQPAEGGTISCTTTSATPGTSVAISNTPAAGYTFKKYTFSIETVMLDSDHFYMPSGNVTVSAEFEKTAYYITPQVQPAGAGIVSVNPGTAHLGDTVTVSQQAAAGYYFDGYTTVPQVAITNDTFTMPDSDVTVTGNYLLRSTASVDKTTLEGGGSVNVTITAESQNYEHRYKLSFGTGMETGMEDGPMGSATFLVNVPLSWSTAIPNQTSKTGGTLTVWTYNGNTMIGTYVISGLTYAVPESVKPVLNSSQVRPERTIDGVTYPAIDDYYVQNHCGVYINATASGSYGATITSITAAISGYTGSRYNYTTLTNTLTFTSGLLFIAGEMTITITITDSRGRTYTARVTRTVQSYVAPSGRLSVWRTDAQGNADDMGVYAKYQLTKQYTQLGSNAITWSISCSEGSASSPADSGNLMPGDPKIFSQLQEYDVTLTIADLLETFTVTAKLPSARFAIYVENGGNRLGFMKVPNQPIPAGKSSTVEISADTQIYIGSQTLEDYIRSLM